MNTPSMTQDSKEPAKTLKEALVDHRVAMFEDLGFSRIESEKLHESFRNILINGKRYEIRLSHHDVKKHLNQGATHRQIIRIFT